jgi:hypothetical protein
MDLNLFRFRLVLVWPLSWPRLYISTGACRYSPRAFLVALKNGTLP